MMKRMTEREAIEYINKHISKIDPYSGEMFAIRGDNFLLPPGAKFHRSHVWEDGQKLSTALPGVCACWIVPLNAYGEWEEIDSIPSMKEYGKYRYLLYGHRVDMDNTENDAGEVILSNHKVIAIVDY